MNKNINYKLLAIILSFYLIAQTFQFVVRLGPLSPASSLADGIVLAQHPLNHLRMLLILASMFLMIPGFILLAFHFYKTNLFISAVALVFFILFCSFEITYRSVEYFQVVTVWGKEYVQASVSEKPGLFNKISLFYEIVHAVYFPLLFSLMTGSLCLLFVSIKNRANRLVAFAMGLMAIQQISRLLGYTPFNYLSFLNEYYYPVVLVTFLILIFWTVRVSRTDDFSATQNVSRKS
jgi:hypothetical protein